MILCQNYLRRSAVLAVSMVSLCSVLNLPFAEACIPLPEEPGGDDCEWEAPEIPTVTTNSTFQLLDSTKLEDGQPLPPDLPISSGSLGMLIENASVSSTRVGYAGFATPQTGQPATRYLDSKRTLITTVKETGENGQEHVCGTYTESIHKWIDVTSEKEFEQTKIISLINTWPGGTPTSDTSRTAGGANDPQKYTHELSSPHSVSDFLSRVSSHNPFNGSFPHSFTSVPSFSLNENKTHVNVKMMRFKWKWGSGVTTANRYAPPMIVVTFHSPDDPSTPTVDESLTGEVVKTFSWNSWATAQESPVYEINPLDIKGQVNGSYAIRTVPMDLDVVHPVTGTFGEMDEDSSDGGYVSVQRLEEGIDVTPVTLLSLDTSPEQPGIGKTRLKFNSGGRYKLYSDAARTSEVTQSTEFSGGGSQVVYIRGFQKSASRGGESVTMQVNVGGSWIDGDSVKFTVVQSEFLFQVKAFIPYAWTEGEEETPGPNGWSPMAGKVAKGDLHPGLGDRIPTAGFLNVFSTDYVIPPGPVPAGTPLDGQFKFAPFRVCQRIVLTPYSHLHSSYDLTSRRKVWTAPASDHYSKATAVNAAEATLKKGFMALSGVTTSTGKPPVTGEDYRQGARTGRIAELHIEAAGKDGAMGWLTSATDDIHWDMWVKVNAETNPLLPVVQFGGQHDSYPAYEIIVIQADGTYKPIHNVSPAPSALPGPYSLDPDNAINVGRSDTIMN